MAKGDQHMKILALFLPLFGRANPGFTIHEVEMVTVKTRAGLMTWRPEDVSGMQVVNVLELLANQ